MRYISSELTALGGTSSDNYGILGHLLWRQKGFHASRESVAVQRVLAQGFATYNAISTLPWLHRHRARRVGRKIAHSWSSSAERFSHLNPKKTFCALINVLWRELSDVKSEVNMFCWIAVVMPSGSKEDFTSTSIVLIWFSEVNRKVRLRQAVKYHFSHSLPREVYNQSASRIQTYIFQTPNLFSQTFFLIGDRKTDHILTPLQYFS